MKRSFLNFYFFFSGSVFLTIFLLSCGGGGGGGAVSSGLSDGKSNVAITLNGLNSRSARAATSVWDTIRSVDLTVYIDNVSSFEKTLTPSDNVALIEEIDVGSEIYAAAVIHFNEANGGGTGNARSETITVSPGANTLSLFVEYSYKLIYNDKDLVAQELSGTYSSARGIPVPPLASIQQEEDGKPFVGWEEEGRDFYSYNLAGIRGNVTLIASYGIAIKDNGRPNLYLYADPDNPDCSNEADWSLAGINEGDTDYSLSVSDPSVVEVTNSGNILHLIGKKVGSATITVTKAGKPSASHVVKVESLLTVSSGMITSFNIPSAMTSVRILVPAELGVTSLSQNAVNAAAKEKLAGINLSDTSITSIPMNVFKDCTNLTDVMLPDTITSIGESAFENCSSLTSFDFSPSLTSLAVNSFSGSGLTSIDLSPCTSLTSIPSSCFLNCNEAATVNIPANITEIGNNSLYISQSHEIVYGGNIEQWKAIHDIGGLNKPQVILSAGGSSYIWNGSDWAN